MRIPAWKILVFAKSCKGSPYRSRLRVGYHLMDNTAQERHKNDTHAAPPLAVYNAYKKYQQMDDEAIGRDLEVVDFHRGLSDEQKSRIVPVAEVSSVRIETARSAFVSRDDINPGTKPHSAGKTPGCTIYEHKDFEGLRLLPSLLPQDCQIMLLDRLMHRELSNPLQKTNIHHDYNIPFPPTQPGSTDPDSFFTYPQSGKAQVFTPLNPHSKHKPLNTSQFLHKKLRWLTLGDQYDWNTRSYPTQSPTPFPADISALVRTLFEDAFTPESGVVLLYSPKDYMPVHRDVSEECERGLASFSLGCDGLFIVARDKYPHANEADDEREQEVVVIRVHSGDVVQMGGATRWAWHAMPKVMSGTCPTWLEDWPALGGCPKEYEKWKGYMKGKRLNISCRQVWSNSK